MPENCIIVSYPHIWGKPVIQGTRVSVQYIQNFEKKATALKIYTNNIQQTLETKLKK